MMAEDKNAIASKKNCFVSGSTTYSAALSISLV